MPLAYSKHPHVFNVWMLPTAGVGGRQVRRDVFAAHLLGLSDKVHPVVGLAVSTLPIVSFNTVRRNHWLLLSANSHKRIMVHGSITSCNPQFPHMSDGEIKPPGPLNFKFWFTRATVPPYCLKNKDYASVLRCFFFLEDRQPYFHQGKWPSVKHFLNY